MLSQSDGVVERGKWYTAECEPHYGRVRFCITEGGCVYLACEDRRPRAFQVQPESLTIGVGEIFFTRKEIFKNVTYRLFDIKGG